MKQMLTDAGALRVIERLKRGLEGRTESFEIY
jgi:hypothetical protein